MKKIFKILGILAFVCIVVVGLTLLIGGRDAGEPDITGLIPEKHQIPEDQNAFPYLMDAAAALKFPPDPSILMHYINDKPADTNAVANILKKNDPAFDKMEKVLAFKHCQAPYGKNASHLDRWYQLAIMTTVRSVSHRKAGQLGAATDDAVALIRLGDMIHPDAQFLADYTAGSKILQLGLEEVGFVLRSKEASPNDLKRIIAVLGSLRPLDQGMIQSLKNKYTLLAESIDTFRSKKMSLERTFSEGQFLPYLLRKTTWYPGYIFKENETKQRLATLYKDTIDNVSKNYTDMKLYDLEKFLGLMGNQFTFFLRPNVVGRIFYAFNTPEFHNYLEGKCQLEGTIRAMCLIAALRLYEMKNGRLPDRLEDLCPEYLPTVPLDSFDGQPFRYSAEKRLIYSVSKDLKDSGGSRTVPPDEIYGEDYPKTWIAEDAVFYMDKPDR